MTNIMCATMTDRTAGSANACHECGPCLAAQEAAALLFVEVQHPSAALRAVCIKLRTALDTLRPFPLVVEPVAAALIAEADAALAAVLSLPKPAGQAADYYFTSSQLADYVGKCRAAWEAQQPAGQPVEGWRERVMVADACPFNAVHGGCHYPDCKPDCPGRPAPASPQPREEEVG